MGNTRTSLKNAGIVTASEGPKGQAKQSPPRAFKEFRRLLRQRAPRNDLPCILEFGSYKNIVFAKRFRADLIVNNVVLVENKASKGITPQDEAQLLNYLKATNLRVGLLMNFGKPSLEFIRRIV